MINNNNTPSPANNLASTLCYGIPLQNPFEVFVFCTTTYSFSLLKTDKRKIASIGLNKYSRLSAYCNGDNRLYISGGEHSDTTKELIDDLWIVNLMTGSIERIPHAIAPKKMHSMICLEESYIFIVGGNDCVTLLYDLNTKACTEWKALNVLRKEPTLALINSYVYAFSMSNGNEVSFERTNIHMESVCAWELIVPVITREALCYKQKLFGVAAYSGDEFMFLGGTIDSDTESKESADKCLCYNVKDNTVNVSDVKFDMLDLGEKRFYPYEEDIDFAIPTFNRSCPVVVLYNKLKREYTSVPFHTDTKNVNAVNAVGHESSSSKRSSALSYLFLPKVDANKYNFNMPSMKASVNECSDTHVIKAPIYMSQVIKEVTDDEEIIDKQETQNVNEDEAQNGQRTHTKLGDVYVSSEGNLNQEGRKIEMKNAGMLFN